VNQNIQTPPVETRNWIEAISVGATDGWKVALGVGIMLLSFVAVIFFINYVIIKITGGHFTLDQLVGYIFSPIAYILGVPHGDIMKFSTLIGQKTIFNEFIAYSNIKSFFPNIVTATGVNFKGIPVAEVKTYMMACFALTGFANFSSIAIQIGGIGELVPSRKSQIAALGLRALLAAVLANLLSAAIVGIFF
jgi:CNT family concentrative nucleoside transporter